VTKNQSIKKDPILSLGCLGALLVPTALFLYTGYSDPAARPVAGGYLAAIAALALAGIIYGRIHPYTQAASSLQNSELERIRTGLLENVETLISLDPRLFEDAISRLFTQMGYNVTQTPYSNDEGKDAIALKNGQKYVIEMKRYARDKAVGRPILMKLHSAMVNEGAASGILVTTCRFSRPAVEFAAANGIRLIDGDGLALLMRETYPNAENPNSIATLCTRCGARIEFDLDDERDSAECPRGHGVSHPIARTVRHPAPRPRCMKCGSELRSKRFSNSYLAYCFRCKAVSLQ